jgi:hypothetical protein
MHREVGQAKDLPAPRYIGLDFVLKWLNARYDCDQHACVYTIQEE